MSRISVAFVSVALLLGGCAAQTPPAQVTRFHLGQPIAPGEIAVEPRDRAAADSLEFRSTATTVGVQLAKVGFRLAPNLAASELVAVVDLVRGSRADLSNEGSGLRVGLGGGSFGGGVGVGGGVSFPVGRRGSREIVGTELAVQIKRRSEGTVIWEGRARIEARAGTPYADPAAAVTKLSSALFAGFPGESGRTILVK